MGVNVVLMDKLDLNKLPRHVGIIMDGNGRWATGKGLIRTSGHKAGATTLKNIFKTCVNLKIPVLTIYAFSTENWKRPKTEVTFLMSLFSSFLAAQIDELCEKFSLTRVELGERIGDSLSSLVVSLLNNIDKSISGLFLTGGDIAMKVIKELKLSNYHIAGEIESGVPYGYFSDNDFSGIPIITKAGAFGSKYVLKNSLVFIKNLTKEY